MARFIMRYCIKKRMRRLPHILGDMPSSGLLAARHRLPPVVIVDSDDKQPAFQRFTCDIRSPAQLFINSLADAALVTPSLLYFMAYLDLYLRFF